MPSDFIHSVHKGPFTPDVSLTICSHFTAKNLPVLDNRPNMCLYQQHKGHNTLIGELRSTIGIIYIYRNRRGSLIRMAQSSTLMLLAPLPQAALSSIKHWRSQISPSARIEQSQTMEQELHACISVMNVMQGNPGISCVICTAKTCKHTHTAQHMTNRKLTKPDIPNSRRKLNVRLSMQNARSLSGARAFWHGHQV